MQVSSGPLASTMNRQREIFIFCYDNDDNFERSKKYSIMGFKDGEDALPEKIKYLRQGDIVLIRNSNILDRLVLYGSCLVKTRIYKQDQREKYDYPSLIWFDEIMLGKMIYPFRLPVDFTAISSDNIIEWDELLKLDLMDSDGELMDKKQIKVFTKGNFYSKELYNQLIEVFNIKIVQQ